MDSHEVAGTVVTDGQDDADEQGAYSQLTRAHPDGQELFDPLGHARGVDDRLGAFEGAPLVHRPPKRATARSSSPGSRPATTSPRRWEHLMPAAAMKVARPMSSAQRATEVERSRAKESRGRSVLRQRRDERARHVAPGGLGPAHDEAVFGPGAGSQRTLGQLGADGDDAGCRRARRR